MYRLDDHQHWHYPHHHHHNTIISAVGRGPQGPKGDPLTYAEMTDAEKDDLASRVGVVQPTATYMEYTITLEYTDDGQGHITAQVLNTLTPPWDPPTAGSVYLVDVNGLTLPDDAYSVHSSTGIITFTNSITAGPWDDTVTVRRIDFQATEPSEQES